MIEKRERKGEKSGKKANRKGEALAKEILETYQPQTVAEMQEALKDIFGPMFEAMLQGELSAHLGYESNERGEKETRTGVTDTARRR